MPVGPFARSLVSLGGSDSAEAGSGVAAGRNRGLQLEQSDSDEAAVVLGRWRQIADGKLSGPWKRHAGLLAPENGIPVGQFWFS